MVTGCWIKAIITERLRRAWVLITLWPGMGIQCSLCEITLASCHYCHVVMFPCSSCKPVSTRTADTQRTNINSDKISTPTSIFRNDPSPPLAFGQSQHVNSGTVGKRHGDWSEPVAGFPEDIATFEVHPPASKPNSNQKRRPFRGMFLL